MMNKYTVKFANQDIIVFAKDHEKAVFKALRTETEKPLGIGAIVFCLKDGDKEEQEVLFSIEYMMDNGYFEGLGFEYVN